jgi:hypothetical protein
MDAMFPPMVVGSFEAITSAASAVVYVAVAILALVKAPRDLRVRLFFVLGLTGIAPYMTPLLFWLRGEDAQFTRPLTLALALSTTFGGLVMFHFMQVFPWRRPWIRAHARWLAAAYVVCPLLASGLIVAAPEPLDQMTPAFAMTLLVVGFPLLVLVGLVLPFAGLLSLYDSWKTAKRLHITAAERPTLTILISQLAGGVLAIVVEPMLHMVLPAGPWTTIAAALLFGFGLMMPVAFAHAIWRDRVLEIDPAWTAAEASNR